MTYDFKRPRRPVDRVFLHCSASDNPTHDSAAVIDAWHKVNGWASIGYHFFIRKDGTLEIGRDLEKTPAAQEGNNTGTIAICLHGLDKAKFTEAQFSTLRLLCSQIDRAYGGRVTFHGHNEVSRKSCPVFDYRQVLGLSDVGEMLGSDDHGDISVLHTPSGPGLETLKSTVTILKFGSKGELVRDLQAALTRLRYFTGAIDGDFGSRTREAVLAFQADHSLETDGKVGPLFREALAAARPRGIASARAFASLSDLAASGSRIAKASQRGLAVGTLIGAGGIGAIIEQVSGQASVIQALFNEHGLVTGVVILAAGAFMAWQSWRAGQARLEDHRTGKTA